MRFLFLFFCFCSAALAQTTKKTAPKIAPNAAPNLVEWKPVLPSDIFRHSHRSLPKTTAPLSPLPLPRLMVPRGTTNVARNKNVTSSDDFPIIGSLPMITDGDKECVERDNLASWVELGPSSQWVQIDLGERCKVYGLHLWHYWNEPRVYRDVIVRVADDAAFTKNVRTLFNNDDDNLSLLGKGNDKEYYERREGFLIDTRGPKTQGQIARYVRLYSRGNSDDPQNQYIEVEVIGQPLPPPLPPMQAYRPELPPLLPQTAPLGVKAPALPRIMVPKGAENLAYKKLVTANNSVLYGSLQQITDGQKDVWMTLSHGLSWVQIDLSAPCQIYAIHLWHGFAAPYVYRDVMIQISDDKTFRKGVTTVFNNSLSGLGPNRPYLESRNGLLLDISGPRKSGVSGRYVRFWSNGSQIDKLNRYTEIKIIGTTDWVEAKFVLPPGKYQ